MEFYTFSTPLGVMSLGSEEGGLARLWLPGLPTPQLSSQPTPLLRKGEEQLREYLAGERRNFDLPLAPQGTPFQLAVWAALREIPWGETRSYGEIAHTVGRPWAFRAVGMANHCNPLPIFIPCHRVVGARGTLTGYAGGLELKRTLLELEGHTFF